MHNDINIAINICTYRREEQVTNNIKKLLSSRFFDETDPCYYSHMFICVIDNGRTLSCPNSEFVKIVKNRNMGGSGGFQKGLETIRSIGRSFSHVVFMDDDVDFDLSSFYILFDFLKNASKETLIKPIAGRMFRADNKDVQYTAAEIWNAGNIGHVGFQKNIADIENEPDVVEDSGADYGGWWLCCYPFEVIKDNDVMPFFIHCDDVEYGLRYGVKPIILKGFQVWHETYEYRQSAIMTYYDTRNSLFVNEKFNIGPEPLEILNCWKDKILKYHNEEQWDYEYYTIQAFYDFCKGLKWLYKIDPAKNHQKLVNAKINRYKNSVLWRMAEKAFYKKYKASI